MFYKKTYLDKSLMEGVGLFSGEDIAKGEELTQNYKDFEDQIRF